MKFVRFFRPSLKKNTKAKVFVPSMLYLALFSTISLKSYANEYAEFDASFLQGFSSAEHIDISRFSYGNPIPEGQYLADVYLNGKLRGRINLQFVDDPAQNNGALCATPTLLTLLDLMPEAIQQAEPQQGCVLFSQAVPEAKTSFTMGTLQLDVNIPQAFITQRPVGYISPSQWQTGIPVGFVRYTANHYRYNNASGRFNQSYLGIDAGINLAGWALRHRGSQTWFDGKRNSYNTIATYAQRDIASLRGQLMIGDFTTSGELLDSVSLRGGQLVSDDRMLATSLRGYAPTIRGIANSNALVTIRQNGNVLREVSVPAGPFVINDLYPTGYAGDLEVEILEANGERRSFRVPYTATAQLIRPGYSRYLVAAGRYRYAGKLFDEKVGQASWQYGLSNNITLQLGGTVSENYHAELMGVAFNTPIGAFSTNVTFANARLKERNEKRHGYSIYASYNTKIEPTNTNVTLAAYRYLSRNYYSLDDTIRANQPEQLDWGLASYRPKHQFQLSINQNLPEDWGYTYFIGTWNSYWGQGSNQTDYQMGYSNSYKKLNYSLSYSETRDYEGEKDRQFYLNLSMNFGESNSTSINQTWTQSRLTGYSLNTAISGTVGEERRYSYNVSLNRYKENKLSSISLGNQYSGSMARVGATWSQDNKQNKQMSLSASGAIVAHPKGVTLSNDLGDTFVIIHAKGADGAKINGTIGNRLDYFGNGILSYAQPYSVNYVGIDTTDISDSVELSATEQQVIPRANNAILVNFNTTVGHVVFFELAQNEHLPPLGTDVLDSEGNVVGMVAQGGKIYTRGVAEKGKLHLQWDKQQCVIDYALDKNQQQGTGPVIVPVQCTVVPL